MRKTTIINSAAMNGVGENTTVRATTPKILALAEKVTIGLGVAACLFIVMWFLGSRKLRRTEEYKAYKAARKAYKASRK